jgi:hypothetical protein
MNVKVIGRPIDVHAKEKLCRTEILHVEFRLNFSPEAKRIRTNYHQIFNMCKDPCRRLIWCIGSMEHTRIRDSGFEVNR